ncbi:hypothetical protein Tco_0721388 [Tanacetum coccineum]
MCGIANMAWHHVTREVSGDLFIAVFSFPFKSFSESFSETKSEMVPSLTVDKSTSSLTSENDITDVISEFQVQSESTSSLTSENDITDVIFECNEVRSVFGEASSCKRFSKNRVIDVESDDGGDDDWTRSSLLKEVRRPADCNPLQVAIIHLSLPNPNLNLPVVGLTPGPNCLFVGGLPCYVTTPYDKDLDRLHSDSSEEDEYNHQVLELGMPESKREDYADHRNTSVGLFGKLQRVVHYENIRVNRVPQDWSEPDPDFFSLREDVEVHFSLPDESSWAVKKRFTKITHERCMVFDKRGDTIKASPNICTHYPKNESKKSSEVSNNEALEHQSEAKSQLASVTENKETNNTYSNTSIEPNTSVRSTLKSSSLDHLGKFDGKADEGTKASDNTGQAGKETEPVKDYILLPLWTADPPYS